MIDQVSLAVATAMIELAASQHQESRLARTELDTFLRSTPYEAFADWVLSDYQHNSQRFAHTQFGAELGGTIVLWLYDPAGEPLTVEMLQLAVQEFMLECQQPPEPTAEPTAEPQPRSPAAKGSSAVLERSRNSRRAAREFLEQARERRADSFPPHVLARGETPLPPAPPAGLRPPDAPPVARSPEPAAPDSPEDGESPAPQVVRVVAESIMALARKLAGDSPDEPTRASSLPERISISEMGGYLRSSPYEAFTVWMLESQQRNFRRFDLVETGTLTREELEAAVACFMRKHNMTPEPEPNLRQARVSKRPTRDNRGDERQLPQYHVARAIMRLSQKRPDSLLSVSELGTFLRGTPYERFAGWMLAGSQRRFKHYDQAKRGGLGLGQLEAAVGDFIAEAHNPREPSPKPSREASPQASLSPAPCVIGLQAARSVSRASSSPAQSRSATRSQSPGASPSRINTTGKPSFLREAKTPDSCEEPPVQRSPSVGRQARFSPQTPKPSSPPRSKATDVARAIMRLSQKRPDSLLSVSELGTFLRGTPYELFAGWMLAGSQRRFKHYDQAKRGGLGLGQLEAAVGDFIAEATKASPEPSQKPKTPPSPGPSSPRPAGPHPELEPGVRRSMAAAERRAKEAEREQLLLKVEQLEQKAQSKQPAGRWASAPQRASGPAGRWASGPQLVAPWAAHSGPVHNYYYPSAPANQFAPAHARPLWAPINRPVGGFYTPPPLARHDVNEH